MGTLFANLVPDAIVPPAVGTAVCTRAEWLDACAGQPAASVDLVYADPPFNTGVTRRGAAGTYADSFGSLDEYDAWLRPRLQATHRLLRPTGAIMIHVDWRTSHRVRVLLDQVFGEACFVNHLVWSYGLGGSSPRRFARKHDDILYYSREPDGHYFEPPRVPATSARLRGQSKKATDVLDVPSINNMAHERVGYPTQKPMALLRMLVGAACPPGGTVFDPCCGSGTSIIAAMTTGRVGIGSDASAEAVKVATGRIEAGA